MKVVSDLAVLFGSDLKMEMKCFPNGSFVLPEMSDMSTVRGVFLVDPCRPYY